MQAAIKSKPPKYLCEWAAIQCPCPEDVKVSKKEFTATASFLKME
jgi:hypothetical protein